MIIAVALAACAPLPVQVDLIIDWFRPFGGSNNTLEPVTSVLPLEGGDVMVTGSPFPRRLARLTDTGATVWEVDIPAPDPVFIAGAASDGAGGVVLMASRFGNGDSFAYRFDGDGNLVWSTVIAPSTTGTFARLAFYDAVGDGAGGIVGAGTEFVAGVGTLGTLFHVDVNGNEVARVAPFGTDVTEIFAVDRAPNGNYGIATTYRVVEGGMQVNKTDVALFDSSLALLWRRQMALPSQGVTVRNVGFGGAGGLYIGINSAFTPLARLQRLDVADGATLWETDFADTEPSSRILDHAPAEGGGVHVCGDSFESPGSAGVIQRFSPSGTGGPSRIFGRAPLDDEVRFDGIKRRGDGLVVFGLGISSLFDLPGQPPLSGLVLALIPERGTTYCGPAVPNSIGQSASITAHGDGAAASGELVLRAQALPPNTTTLFIVGSEQGSTPILGNGQGIICLGGLLGRYGSQIGFARPDGVSEVNVDPAATPTPAGPVAITAGQTWNFQCWYRDTNPTATSNATDAVSVVFD